MKQFNEEAEGEKKVLCIKIRVGHPKYKTVDFFLFYMKENALHFRAKGFLALFTTELLSGVVYRERKFVVSCIYYCCCFIYVTSSVNN